MPDKDKIKILVACEESQAVCIAFRNRGFQAFSCDIQECSGGHQEWHIQGDAVAEAYSGKYDMMIAHPPCTHLAVSGARHFEKKRKDGRQQDGIELFMKFINAPVRKIAVENPICIMSSVYRKPSQIIQPFEFGHKSRKATCLWLKSLPRLIPTSIVEPDLYVCKNGKTFSRDYMLIPPGENRGGAKVKNL